MSGKDFGRPFEAGIFARLARVGDMLADLVGHLATLALLCLTGSIVLGIVFRWVGIDNSWTYDLDLYSLAWTAFAGAVLTARYGRHVTAGIALERMVSGMPSRVLRLIRVIIVVGFLILLTISAWWLTISSIETNEKTIDVVQWPVWIAEAALPFGAAFWALAELCNAILPKRRAAGDSIEIGD